MARILFLTELLPYPLISGAKIRAYYVLRHLAARHQVTLLSFVRADDSREDVAHLEGFLEAVHAVPMRRGWLRDIRAVLVSLLTGRPAIVVREEILAMRRQVEQLIAPARFDVIHADQIPMAQYGLRGRSVEVQRLLDQHNATFRILERLAGHEKAWLKRLILRRESRAFAAYEVQVCRQFDHVTFVTEEDRQALSMRGPRAPAVPWLERTTVIPICVDTEAIHPVTPVRAPFRITHVGTMYWPPNVEGILWFWESVWDRVCSQVPEARLTLIGKSPPDAIQALGRQEGVDVLGYVKDLTPYLAETAVFVIPLHAAGGMRVKILDAWCWGVPIVSTTVGAEGIAIQDGDNILVQDTPEGFAEGVVRLLRDRALRNRLQSSGRRWVQQHYDWRRVYSAWDDVYAKLLQT